MHCCCYPPCDDLCDVIYKNGGECTNDRCSENQEELSYGYKYCDEGDPYVYARCCCDSAPSGIISQSLMSCQSNLISIGQKNTCITNNCNEGFWIITNEEGSPLDLSVYSSIYDIPPSIFQFVPSSEGKVRVTALCLEPFGSFTHLTTVVSG